MSYSASEVKDFSEKRDQPCYPTTCQLIQLRRKLLNALLDKSIMAIIAKRSVISAPHVIAFFNEKYNLHFSPGMIYPTLYRIENQRYIKKLPNKTKKLYVLTIQGEEDLERIQCNVEEIHYFLTTILRGC
jgi:DNA-binding PadR family transcriptional regulator